MPARHHAIPVREAEATERVTPGVIEGLLLLSLGWLGIWIGSAVLTPTLHHILPFQIAGGLFMIAGLVLNRLGRTRVTAIVFCSGMWVLVQVPPFVTGGLAVPAILLPPLLVLGTGMMWSTRAAVVLAVLSSLGWLIGLLAIEQGLVSAPDPPQSGFQFWLLLTGVLAVVSAGLVMMTRTLRGTLWDSTAPSPEVSKALSVDGPTAEPGSIADDEGTRLPGSGDAGPDLEDLGLVGQLAGGIAHDFNNLLTVVGGATELIEHDPQATRSILELAGQIRIAQERAAFITSQILAFAQRQVVHTRRLEVASSLRQLVQTMDQLMGPEITVELSATAEDTTVLSSDTELEQILHNLVTNARDALDGVGTISIRVERRQLDVPSTGPAGIISSGDYVVMSVEDGGKGISPDVLPHVFEPFYSTHDRSSGRGLGLPAVLGIARRSLGQVLIESTRGSGTLVEVLLPLAAPS
ncbi:MAG: ATP-binding protein [Myxococcota bacterium]|nr:ATP-binding protein [Myxococcota bacterium]